MGNTGRRGPPIDPETPDANLASDHSERAKAERGQEWHLTGGNKPRKRDYEDWWTGWVFLSITGA